MATEASVIDDARVSRLVWSSAAPSLRRAVAAVTARNARRRLSSAPEPDGSADPGAVMWRLAEAYTTLSAG